MAIRTHAHTRKNTIIHVRDIWGVSVGVMGRVGVTNGSFLGSGDRCWVWSC